MKKTVYLTKSEAERKNNLIINSDCPPKSFNVVTVHKEYIQLDDQFYFTIEFVKYAKRMNIPIMVVSYLEDVSGDVKEIYIQPYKHILDTYSVVWNGKTYQVILST